MKIATINTITITATTDIVTTIRTRLSFPFPPSFEVELGLVEDVEEAKDVVDELLDDDEDDDCVEDSVGIRVVDDAI